MIEVFMASLIIRAVASGILWIIKPNFHLVGLDSREYNYLYKNFKPLPEAVEIIGNYKWYQRTPMYVLFLYVCRGNLLPQMILSSLGVALMYEMNTMAGLIWMFWIPEIFDSMIYMKYTLYNFLIILVMYFFDSEILRFIGVLAVTVPLVSYGVVINYNFTLNKGYMQQPYEMWKPSFHHLNKYIALFWIIPYALLMFYWIRNVEILSFPFLIVILFTVVYSYIGANWSFRTHLMPIIILSVGNMLK